MESGLAFLGLSDNETKLYTTLLKRGPMTGSEIRKATHIANSRVYAGLDTLIGKGLVTYKKRAKGKLFSAADPSVLSEIVEHHRKKVEETIPYLKEIQNSVKSKTETAVFEGVSGFKAALLEIVHLCPPKETIQIIGFTNASYQVEALARILREVNRVSIRKKHQYRVILDNKSNKFFADRIAEDIADVRFMGKGFSSPAAIDIFEDSVYILVWGETPFAFSVKNAEVAEGFKTYFDFMWRMAKP